MLVSGVPALELSAVAATTTSTSTGATQLSKCTVTLATTSYVYDGSAKTPGYTVKNGSKALTRDKDFTVSYQNNVNPGTGKVVFKGKGSYTGSVTKSFTIKKNIANTTVTFSTTSYVYDGKAKTPAVTVKDGTATLVKDTDYTVSYSNNVTIGTNTAKAVVKGKGSYGGSVTKTFTITKRNVANFTVTFDKSSFEYNGKALKPNFSITDSVTGKLSPGSEYIYTYRNNLNAGTAEVIITAQNGMYTGTKTAYFTISPKSFSGCTLTVDASSYTYSGSAIVPVVTVTDGTATVASSNYTVSCTNNVNAGTATVTVKGKGNYTGTLQKTFRVDPKNISNCTITASPASYTYDGTAKKPAITVKDGSNTVPATNYSVAYSDNVKAGNLKVTVTGKVNYKGTVTKTVKINPKSISGANLALEKTSYVYNVNAIEPAVTLKDGSKVLVKGTDYKVEYKNNVNAGTATVTVTGIGNYTGSRTAGFTIVPQQLSDNKISVLLGSSVFIYDGLEKAPKVTVRNGNYGLAENNDYTYTIKNNVNVGDAVVTITGKGNYKGTREEKFHIIGRDISDAVVTLSLTKLFYDGRVKTPVPTVKYQGNTLKGKNDYTVSYENNVKVGTATAIVTGIGTFRGEKRVNFQIAVTDISEYNLSVKERNPGTDTTPSVSVYKGSITLKEKQDYEVEYLNNSGIGTASVKVRGVNNCKGTLEGSFAITKFTYGVNNWSFSNSDTHCFSGECEGSTFYGRYKYVGIVSELNRQRQWFDEYYDTKYNESIKGYILNTQNNQLNINNATISLVSDVVIDYDDYVSEYNNEIDETGLLNHLRNKTKIIVRSGNTVFRSDLEYKDSDYTVSFEIPNNKDLSGSTKIGVKLTDRNGRKPTDSKGNERVWTIELLTRSNMSSWCWDSVIDKFENHYFSKLQNSAKNTIRKIIYQKRLLKWTGSCSGMVNSAILLNQGDAAFIQLFEEYTGQTFENVYSVKLDDKVISIINYMQFINNGYYNSEVDNCFQKNVLNRDESSSPVTISMNKTSRYNMITKLEELVKSQNHLVRIAVKWYNYSDSYSHHIIAAYGIEDCNYYSSITELKYDKRILIYDPNMDPNNNLVHSHCIYYDSETHSYFRPVNSNSYSELYWTNESEIPENDNTKGDPEKKGVIKHISIFGKN